MTSSILRCNTHLAMLKVQHSVLPLIKINQNDSKRNQHTLKHFFLKMAKLQNTKKLLLYLKMFWRKKSHFFKIENFLSLLSNILQNCIIDSGLHTEIERWKQRDNKKPDIKLLDPGVTSLFYSQLNAGINKNKS